MKKPNLQLATDAISKKAIELRREIHQYPELKYEEKRTQDLILRELKAEGIKGTKIAGTGVTAMIPGGKGKPDGKVLMLRADMDALPVEEETDCDFKSKIPGKMHACGHDSHVAMLLVAAKLLKDNPVGGPVKLCFQPAEEGGIGAQAMIDDGILENPTVGAAFGIHSWVGIPAGKMGITFGPCMAAVDEFTVTVKGVGGHAAYPHKSVDPVFISAQIISALQSIVSRNFDPVDTGVVTVASINAGSSFNIIPPEVKMMGTCRTFSDEGRKIVEKRFKEIVNGIAKSMGGSVEIDFKHQLPATVNDEAMCEIMWKASEIVLGRKNVIKAKPTMGGEDMSLYLRKVPGCFAFLGAGNPAVGAVWPHHHPKFTLDESVFGYGVEILYRAAELYYSE
ncbi:MAG TPA: amidohydrolase [Firmicutes bacterium]|nr:amidohydrolase [Bacillota bacterium]